MLAGYSPNVVSPYPPDDEVIANVEAMLAEMRQHVDHQSTDAESVDTKATAILTVTAAGATLVAARIGALDTDIRRLSAFVTVVVLVSLTVSLFQALRPREKFSYGPTPRTMMRYADRQWHKPFMLWMADSFVQARDRNVEFLDAKQGWYQRALRCLVATVIGVAWMVQTGAIM